ncbi:unnamed protein product [Dimorphilus gyrociliatus]|uniref:Cyclin-dependent kinase 7 n=1 Tax=Dimorphilus gyrociliatus TaxID=2664684 RepID=A0A7I8VKD7_9ANNE|nr:unnamed protein product [Dimorphilus gyrociliatus]
MAAERSKRYEKIEFLGEGQFATVYKARDKEFNDRIVAVKKIKIGTRVEAEDGINRTALREIKILQEISHPNVIGLLDVFGRRSNVSLVFDYMHFDLEVIIKDQSVIFLPSHIKNYLMQTLRGLEYLHANWILHRDMKPNNLLINNDGVLKIGDFGLAKVFGSPDRIYTHQVVTRWYRSPELLYGARQYGTGVDIWATACILAELLLRVPFVAGDSDLNQLSKIFEALGTPKEDDWPEMTQLPDYIEFKYQEGTPLKQIFTAAGQDLLDLLESMFKFDPLRRCTAAEALKMDYFSSNPQPTANSSLPKPTQPSNVLKEPNIIKPGMKRKLEPGESDPCKRLLF